MTSRENSDVVEDAGGHNAGRTLRQRDWMTVAMWLAILASSGMLGWAAVQRLSSAAEAELQWVPIAEGDDSPVESNSVGNLRREVSAAALTSPSPQTDPFAEMGERLDDPELDGQDRDQPASANEEIPLKKRWRIKFPDGTTEAEYARQLASLGIELGVLRADGNVEYVTHPGSADAKRRTGRREDDKRLYWTWERGDLSKADEALLKNAGVHVAGDVVLHFCPQATQDRLLAMETEFKKRQAIEILQTRFAVRRTFRGYEVYVEEQMTR